jgi:DNA processing protein
LKFDVPRPCVLLDRFYQALCHKWQWWVCRLLKRQWVQADLDWTKANDCHILTLIDDGYPEQLKTISDPPPLLYVRGDGAL